jgi:hypothetical protein
LFQSVLHPAYVRNIRSHIRNKTHQQHLVPCLPAYYFFDFILFYSLEDNTFPYFSTLILQCFPHQADIKDIFQ